MLAKARPPEEINAELSYSVNSLSVIAMHPARALLAGAVVLSCAGGHSKAASRAEFAVEFSGRSYVVVRDRGLTSLELFGDSLHPRAGVTPHTGPPVTVKLDFTVEEHKVLTTVYTLPRRAILCATTTVTSSVWRTTPRASTKSWN